VLYYTRTKIRRPKNSWEIGLRGTGISRASVRRIAKHYLRSKTSKRLSLLLSFAKWCHLILYSWFKLITNDPHYRLVIGLWICTQTNKKPSYRLVGPAVQPISKGQRSTSGRGTKAISQSKYNHIHTIVTLLYRTLRSTPI